MDKTIKKVRKNLSKLTPPPFFKVKSKETYKIILLKMLLKTQI